MSVSFNPKGAILYKIFTILIRIARLYNWMPGFLYIVFFLKCRFRIETLSLIP